MKRHVPDPVHLGEALARRLDAVENRLAALEGLPADVAALGRAVAEISEQMKRLTTATTGRLLRSAGNGSGSGPSTGTAAGDEDAGDGQPNWLAVDDPESAGLLLEYAGAFIRDVLAPLGAAPPAGCWPLHPGVVVELVALQREHGDAYAGDSPTPVSEWLARWLPGARERVFAELSACVMERGHRHGGRIYDATGLDPARIARWWADTHGQDPDAVEAFALTRIA